MSPLQTPSRFDLRFGSRLDLVSSVRRFVDYFFARALADADLTSRMALATHELLENAVKYSTTGETDLRISVASPSDDGTVVIQTSNVTSPENLRVVAGAFADMSEVSDPFD